MSTGVKEICDKLCWGESNCVFSCLWNHLTVRGSQEVIENRDTTQTCDKLFAHSLPDQKIEWFGD